MKHVVGFSGGSASAVMAKIVADENPANTVLLFHDTKTEHVDNARFRNDISEYIGLPITDDSDGRDIWQVFRDKGFLGNGRNTPCSQILKQDRSLRYLREHQPAVIYIGFTVEEWRRAQRTQARYALKGIEARFPLLEQGITKEDCYNRIKNCWGIAEPKVYSWAEHANCIPCVKGKMAYWGLIYKFEREAWERAASAEEEFGHTIFTEAGSLREELFKCLRLAKKYLKNRDARKAQSLLFDTPCECVL